MLDQSWCPAKTVYGRSGAILVHGDDSLKSFRTSHVVQHNMQLSICVYRTDRWSLGKYFQIIVSLNDFGLAVLSRSQSLAIIRCLVFSLTIIQAMPVTSLPPPPVDWCWSTSLAHCVFLLHSAPISNDDMFRDVLSRLDRIVSWCVVVRAHDISNISPHPPAAQFDPLRILAVHQQILLKYIFLPSIGFVVSFVYRLVSRENILSPCDSCRWHQSSPFNWYGISDSIIIFVIVFCNISITFNGPVLGHQFDTRLKHAPPTQSQNPHSKSYVGKASATPLPAKN